ncbi:Tn7-like element transposition protein TnsE [Kordiimonas lacus]|uniref:TnsE C-terminal domain-containing protein n=1 Tax=Kordiimonas lacus TaxID=637679 RepID=A0A1G7F4F0_9PROT|nr:Tn7-like element transposition protein TnsE [Kordiimonas lacus]SDE70761.1 hypothetical protein SAMN04488071_3612 [Kordiimonas lacus]
MGRTTIRSIPNNSQLRHLGNCFRRKEAEDSWKIAAQYLVEGIEANKRFDFGMMSVLALRKRYDKKATPKFESSGFRKTFALPPTSTWQRTTVDDFPLFPRKSTRAEHHKQTCYRFQAYGLTVWLPSLELARSLFFPSSYLAHLSLQPEGLNGSFHAKKLDDGNIEIHMLPGANFPKYYFARQDYRVHLAWLLLNENVRTSFGSIAANRLANQIVDEKYARWVFDFNPPDLTDTKIHAFGHFNEERKAFFVYDISGFSNLDHKIEGEVHFSDTSSPIPGEGGNKPGFGISSPPVEDLELEDEFEPSAFNHHYIAQTPVVGFNFKRRIQTKKTGPSSRKVGGSSQDDGLGAHPIVGSIAESGILGTLPQSDFSQLNTEIDYSELEERFAMFKKLVDLLHSPEGLDVVSSDIRAVPQLPRCSSHLMMDGSKRHYMHVIVHLPDGRIRHILEVDTSDGKTALATKVLEFGREQEFAPAIQSILTQLIKKSLTWPSKHLDEICTYNQSVPHPKCKAIGYIEQDELLHWRDRMLFWAKAT